jgi:hypothetical protein
MIIKLCVLSEINKTPAKLRSDVGKVYDQNKKNYLLIKNIN